MLQQSFKQSRLAHWQLTATVPEQIGLSHVLSACKAQSLWGAALSTLAWALQHRPCPDKINFSIAISSLAAVGSLKTVAWCTGLGMLTAMSKHQIEGDIVSYSCMINTVSHKWAAALALFCELSSCALSPNVVACGSVVSACATCQWRGVASMLLFMRATQVRPLASQSLLSQTDSEIRLNQAQLQDCFHDLFCYAKLQR